MHPFRGMKKLKLSNRMFRHIVELIKRGEREIAFDTLSNYLPEDDLLYKSLILKANSVGPASKLSKKVRVPFSGGIRCDSNSRLEMRSRFQRFATTKSSRALGTNFSVESLKRGRLPYSDAQSTYPLPVPMR